MMSDKGPRGTPRFDAIIDIGAATVANGSVRWQWRAEKLTTRGCPATVAGRM